MGALRPRRRAEEDENVSGFVVWMTGLSGAGKSTLATLLTQELTRLGVHVECLDGDEVRKNLSHGLGFSREDRDRNVRRIGYVARMVARSGACAITAAISPYRALRDEIRTKTENFLEVYCDCPMDVLTSRDPKGLYKRAFAGELKNFTGVDDPYEAPEDPEVWLHTDRQSKEECVQIIMAALKSRGLLNKRHSESRALLPPFGGEVFQSRYVPRSELAGAFPQVEIDRSTFEATQCVALGLFSPVCGFMTEREAVKVRKSSALEGGTPFWNVPFVLAAPADLGEVGEKATLVHEGKAVGLVRVEQIWNDEREGQFLAGPVEAVAEEDKNSLSAREVRALARESQQAPICVFAARGPTPVSDAQLRMLEQLSALTVVLVPMSAISSWRSVGGPNRIVVPLPSDFPLADPLARGVVERSLGAHSSALLE